MASDKMHRLSIWPEQDQQAPGPRAELLFGGDFCPIGRFEQQVLAGQPIFHPDLQACFRQSFSMVNLEAPLCDRGVPSASYSGSGLRGEPALAASLKAMGITAVGLANNHIQDFGDEGVRQTLASLTQAGVDHTGAGMNLRAAEVPLVATVNGLRVGIWALAEKELNLAGETVAGAAWFSPERNLEVIRELRPQYDFLVLYIHAGHEFIAVPSPRIRSAYRAYLEAGADVVIGHHPHVMQGVERHGPGLIAYSLGNLVFDSPYQAAHAGTDAGYLLRLTVAPQRICRAEVMPYRAHAAGLVTPLNDPEMAQFTDTFQRLSQVLGDDQAFQAAWEAGVRERWPEYRRILLNLSRNFENDSELELTRRCRNLFGSPTHTEMLEYCLLMVEAGKLSRQA
jgi:hypothetical protein